MMIVNDAPRYIVIQNIATPIKHITVAIIVAYGIRVIHDLQQFPVRTKKKQKYGKLKIGNDKFGDMYDEFDEF